MSIQSPRLSVIIPTYNSSGTLKLSLESVRRQDFQDYEVIIVGDGCTDDSESIVRSFDEQTFRWTNLPVNSGTPAAPRNEGLRLAQGKLIAYLGHDDLWFPSHLDHLVELIETSGADLVYSLGANIGPQGIVNFFSLPRKLNFPHGGLSPSNWLHRKSLVENLGGWSTKTRVSEDQEYLKRLWKHNIHLCGSSHFSVLKFPSPLWGMYSLSGQFPQEKYLTSIKQDPRGFRLNILENYVSVLSRRHRGTRPGNRWILLGRDIVRFVINLYGRNRWPFKALLYRHYRRKSGLDSKKERNS